MKNPKTLALTGAVLAILALVIPRLPLFQSGLGSGRLSIVGAHALCASALSGAASGRCAAVSAASAARWLVLLAGLALLALAAYRALTAADARRPAPPAV